ncbi:MAG TPA: hypothetical protein V6D08_11670 [Candidatus Obscuribacterales bacterium]
MVSYNASLESQCMDIKKRPPPGATLISRLREGRLRREQALAEKKAQQSEQVPPAAQLETPPAAQEEATVQEAPAGLKAKAQETAPPASKAAAKAEGKKRRAAEDPAAASADPGTASVEPITVEVTDVLPAAGRAVKSGGRTRTVEIEVEDFSPQPAAARLRPTPQPAGLLRRSISIDDLRPITDDYEVLTEEIRLAGRFAAAGLVAQGLRLARLKDDNIYKEHYTTFEEYCRKEHNMSATYAYRLIRMSEMAERLADEGTHAIGGQYADSMPDPFEVMLGLGHRHLLALLPLETDAAQDLLVHGVPVVDDSGKVSNRIPINQATEQQIRQALKLMLPAAAEPKAKKKPQAVPAARSVRTLRDIVELLTEWADWLDSEPDQRFLDERVGQGREKSRLAQRLRTAVDRILELL